MSVKSKAKAVGGFLLKYVLTAGIGALVDRYVKGAAAEAVKNGIKVAVGEAVDHKRLAPAIQDDINRAIRDKALPAIHKHLDAAGLGAQAQVARGLRKRK